jgi:hypothetical protein
MGRFGRGISWQNREQAAAHFWQVGLAQASRSLSDKKIRGTATPD